jgi:twinkle protein
MAIIINKETKAEYEVNLNSTGETSMVCPACSHERKKKHIKCFNFNIEKNYGHCGHCGMTAYLKTDKVFIKREYIKPVPRLEKVSEKVINWFEKDRLISNNTLLRFRVTEAKEWMPQYQKEVHCICFNYYRDEELVNIKFRGQGKTFKLAKDAELIFYNLDGIKDEKTAVIVEGEMDCLSMHEAGIYNVVSVPNGAAKGNQKLEYLDNCWQYFENKEKIVIAVDDDEAGHYLKEELARRLDKSRCYLVSYPEGCKDANEVLMKYGKSEVKAMVENATIYPLEGILTADDLSDKVGEYFMNGYPKGKTAGIAGFDDHLSFMEGQLTMVTGIPGSGKDEFVNTIAVGLAKNHGWKFGVVGFEEPEDITVTKLIEKHGEKSFAFRKDPWDRLTQDEFEKGLFFVNDYFFFINTNEVEATVDSVLSKFQELVKRFGINAVIISPWNCFEHNIPIGQNETLYTSTVLGKILMFLKKNNLHCFLIAHPTKIQKDKNTRKYEVPTLYSISGSAHFFNKTHNGISIYRDFETGIVDVYVQKVKWSWLGKLGYCSFNYNTMTRQYVPLM